MRQKIKQWIRDFLGITDLDKSIVELTDEVKAARHALGNHDQYAAEEYKKLRAAIDEVRGILGLDPHEVRPRTTVGEDWSDPHGL